jgi:diguanylate cyclase (GGDEF)-like protein
MEKLQSALASGWRSGSEGALLFIDLDNFKMLNDTLGHGTGDLLLQQVAQRLHSSVREADTVARLGGDEFVVLLTNLSGHTFDAAVKAEAIGEKILALLNLPYSLDDREYRCTASIGVSMLDGKPHTAEALMRQADIAMYQAKKSGRNIMLFFDPDMQTSVTEHAALADELRKALDLQQLQLYYQAQVDDAGKILGAETLIRWQHPERGFVSPAQFIPLAEESDLILRIGSWVLETACAQIKAWEYSASELVLAVNVSPKQFRQKNFVAQVKTTVQRHAIDPSRLKLELTEGMLIENVPDIIASMNDLKEFGILFSLDDFGTGYSSLQYLKKLPLNQLKIDQSFVRDMATECGDNAIVQTIIAMAKSLKLEVIAEGVETAGQQNLLRSYGCTHYQGYLFSKPLPIEEFTVFLQRKAF